MKRRKAISTETSSTATKVCNCLNRRGAVGLYYTDRDLNNDVVWVCAECKWPIWPGYNKYIDKCESCLDEFSSPWEVVCFKCHEIEHSDIKLEEGRIVRTPHTDAPSYRGWAWGRSTDEQGLRVRLSEGRMPGSTQGQRNRIRSL